MPLIFPYIFLSRVQEFISTDGATTSGFSFENAGPREENLAILKSFSDPRIHIFFNEGKHGFVDNFSNALSRAKGDYRAMKRMIEEDGLATKCSVASRAINQLLTLDKITSKWIELV